jgi:hypothetical protein
MSAGPTASNSMGLIGVELYRPHADSVSATNFVFAAVQNDLKGNMLVDIDISRTHGFLQLRRLHLEGHIPKEFDGKSIRGSLLMYAGPHLFQKKELLARSCNSHSSQFNHRKDFRHAGSKVKASPDIIARATKTMAESRHRGLLVFDSKTGSKKLC